MKDNKGLWLVIIQYTILPALGLAGLFQPNTLPLFPWTRTVGAVMAWAGFALTMLSCLNLGRNLTVMPKPKEDGTLIQTGLFKFVRHPLYFSILLAVVGWSLWRASWLALLFSVALYVLFDRKASHEEALLREKFPEYEAYAKRVKKLIP